jgi:hypothetical protein
MAANQRQTLLRAMAAIANDGVKYRKAAINIANENSIA